MKTMQNRICCQIVLPLMFVAMLLFISCDSTPQSPNRSAVIRSGGKALNDELVSKLRISEEHKVYVPAYSHIYHRDNSIFYLTNTLSIRNTDTDEAIYVASVKYYDTRGKVLRDYIREMVKLPPMATLEYVVGEKDIAGGSGANFVVEWLTEKPVSQPVVECVMISTSSQQGISFRTSGVVIN